MNPQPSLFDQPSPRIPRGWSISADFRRFHEANPQVYQEIVRLARLAKEFGHQRWGIGAIIEVVRWNNTITTEGEAFKINNNFRTAYARLVMATEPDLKDFFYTRTQRAG